MPTWSIAVNRCVGSPAGALLVSVMALIMPTPGGARV